MHRNRLVTIIRKSCLTGNVVWIYRGPSESAARRAYLRACRREMERVRHWGDRTAIRMSNVTRLLGNCMDGMPINGELTPEQTEAARQLRSIGRKGAACHREFYDHIMEERRRRREDREIRRRMRERDNK